MLRLTIFFLITVFTFIAIALYGPGRVQSFATVTRVTNTPEHVLTARPYPGAVETITAWHGQGHFIHITSHRDADAHPHTSEWLTNIGLPHDELYCSDDKIARCVEIGIDVLIDDAPSTLERARELGIVAATLEHPWNRDIPGVIIAKDWAGLAERLRRVLA